MSKAQPHHPHPLAMWLQGTVLKTRPFFQRFKNTPPIRLAIAARWIAWLARGWPPTTTALGFLSVLVTMRAPWFVGLVVGGMAWGVGFERYRPQALLAIAAGCIGLVWTAWSDPIIHAAAIATAAIWVIDGLVPLLVSRYRLERWFAEVRRGFPIRYAIMAAKSTRIQGVIDGEQQLTSAARPILDHPALALKARWDGHTAWVRCTVPPGRNASALAEVLGELASSWHRVNRIDLLFDDNYHTYGWLLITFDNPTTQTPHLNRTPKPDRRLWPQQNHHGPQPSDETTTTRHATRQRTAMHADYNQPPNLRLVPADISDPYPERVTHEMGARPHTPPKQPTPRKSTTHAVPHRPPPTFAASLKARPRRTRKRQLPVASTVLNLTGQAGLGAAIASGTVQPAIGATAAVGWMTCGLLVIVCQVISQTRHTTPETAAGKKPSPTQVVGGVGEAEDGPQGRPQVRATHAPALGNTELLLLPADTNEVAKW